MDELPSAQFRKVYAKLTKPVKVTVNGHAIGTWTPAHGYLTVTELQRQLAREEVAADAATVAAEHAFNTRGFMPVPKRKS